MRALIVDTETTGLDANKDAVIELAAALYDVDLREVVWCYASLVPGCTKNPVAAINGINDQLLAKSQDLPDPFSIVREVVDQADVIVAHNADFDRGMVKGRLGDKPWVCTVQQIRFPKATSSRKLAHLAADHGIPYVGAHRAMADVLMVAQLLGRVPDLEAQLKGALKPAAIYQACVSYDQREQAKARGFTWNSTARRWERRMPIDEAEATKRPTNDRPFAIVRVA